MTFGVKIRREKRDPELKPSFGCPVWWHNHGDKMKIDGFEKDTPLSLSITGSAAQVKIFPFGNDRPVKNWLVVWKIRHGLAEVEGSVVLKFEKLLAAFGLSEEFREYSGWLVEQFGCDSACQGGFIRWKNFLNIPCPGTGNDGDPNVSIFISREIKDAVRKLLDNN